MALMVQRTRGGGVRVIPARARSVEVRRLAAGMHGGFAMRGRAGEQFPGRGLSFGGILKGIGRGVGGFLAGGVPGAIGGIFGGGSGGVPSTTLASGCPEGFVLKDGRCQRAGLIGTGQRLLPGGETGFLPTTQDSGTATVGAFGLPARFPAQVGQIQDRSGISRPILRCARGMVLGKDDLCYPKQILTPRSSFRKHKRPPRPPLTAADSQAIRRAARARDRVKALAGDVGFTVRAKGAPARKTKRKSGSHTH